MNGARQAADSLRQPIGLALILLFGPAPLISLLAQAEEPQCQMACCKRMGLARSCTLHHSAVPDSSSDGFHAGPHCPTGCSYAAGGPSAFKTAFLLPDARLSLPAIEKNPILAARASGVRWIIDSYLYQRPPPVPSA